MGNSQKIRIIGLSGQSGAGKSTVRRVFEENGFDVIDCDAVARKIASKSAFLNEISERFGREILSADGTLDRVKTAAMIYNDKAKYAEYCGVIFPYITYDIMRQIERFDKDILLDAPTLFEAGIDGLCSGIVSVVADIGLCAERISKRDKITLEKARERLSSQHGADFFREHSDFVIENNGSEKGLYEKAQSVIDKMKGR